MAGWLGRVRAYSLHVTAQPANTQLRQGWRLLPARCRLTACPGPARYQHITCLYLPTRHLLPAYACPPSAYYLPTCASSS